MRYKAAKGDPHREVRSPGGFMVGRLNAVI
jgi:hypothetical protein